MAIKDPGGSANADFALSIAARRLASLGFAEERGMLRERLGPIERWPRGATLGVLHRPPPARILVTGWACRQIMGADGRRQIVGFILPGDVVGLPCDIVWSSRCEIGTLTAATTACARRLIQAGQDISTNLTSELTAVRHEDALSQIMRLGGQSAHSRIASLLLELHARLAAMQLVREDDAFYFPLTHEHLADATGLSAVHVNRVLQDLRRRDVIDLARRRLVLRRMDALAELAAPSEGRSPGLTAWGRRAAAPRALVEAAHADAKQDRIAMRALSGGARK